MPKFEVAFPIISGFNVFTVEAETPEEATQKVLDGECECSEYDCVEVNFDPDFADITKI